MQDYRRLRVWFLARQLALHVIQALPPHHARKVPGLRAQAIRAATSVDANIVEGCGQPTRREFLAQLETAVASLNELEGHLSLAREAGVLEATTFGRLQEEMGLLRRMLLSLIGVLRRRVAQDESNARNVRKGSPGQRQ
jgi:four helix bundle protein